MTRVVDECFQNALHASDQSIPYIESLPRHVSQALTLSMGLNGIKRIGDRADTWTLSV